MSGMMSANSLVCLTCPAITACVTPAAFSRLMHVPELSERHPVHGRGRRPRGSLRQFGKGFFLERDDGDVVARAAGRVEHQEREPAVPRDETQVSWTASSRNTGEDQPCGHGLLFVDGRFLGPPGRAPQDHAALRRADEVEQILHFGAGERLVLLDLLQRARRVQLRLQQVAERALQLLDDVGRETRGASGRSCWRRRCAPGGCRPSARTAARPW